MTSVHAVILIAAASLVTILLRFLPFIVLRGKETPPVISYLGKVLSYAIMAMLVVYCLKDMQITVYPYGAPELIASAATALIHVWKRNSLLSIVLGTLCYMILIQFVFA